MEVVVSRTPEETTRRAADAVLAGLPPGHPEGYREVLLRDVCAVVGLSAERLSVPDGSGRDLTTLVAAARAYEDRIRDAGGIDVQVLGIGANGDLGFNEPGSALTSRTRVKPLLERTRRDNARFFRDLGAGLRNRPYYDDAASGLPGPRPRGSARHTLARVAHVSGRIHIAAPVGLVFDTVADSRNEPSFNPAMRDVDMLTPPPIGLGTRFRAHLGRARTEMVVEITEFDRPRRLGSRTTSPLMTTVGGLTFEPDGDGTLMAWDWDVQPVGWERLLSPLFGVVGRRLERRIWEGLKRRLESGGGPS